MSQSEGWLVLRIAAAFAAVGLTIWSFLLFLDMVKVWN